MEVVKGAVVGGNVILDGKPLLEGTEVAVFVAREECEVRLPPHLQRELEEADREDGISIEEFFAELRKFG